MQQRTPTRYAKLTAGILLAVAIAIPSASADHGDPHNPVCFTFPPPDGQAYGGFLIIDDGSGSQRVGVGIVLEVLIRHLNMDPNQFPGMGVVGIAVDYSACPIG